jgi:6-phosphogluconolactonase
MNSVRIFSDLNHLAEAMALRFSEEARQAAREDRLYSVVLTGGVTASKIYRLFGAPGSGDNIPWESVHLFWTDERCVPPESNESNFGTAHRAFLNDLSIPDENIHRIDGEDNPAVEANRYACEIQSHLKLRNNSKYCFDWVLMGLGMDGHTASLFPGQEALLNPQGFCDVAEHPETKQKRITLTAPMLQRAKHITYHVVGSGGIPGYRARIRPIVSRITIHWPSFYNVVTGKTLALPNLIALQHIPLSPAGVIAKRPAPIALPNSCAAEWRMAPDAVFSPYASVRYFTPHMVHSQYNLL